MPAKSRKQQQLMAIAEHNPSAVSAKNRGVLNMSHQQLHDFAATKGAPKKVSHSPKPKRAHGESHAYDWRKKAPLSMKLKS
jgi:hypothetical protein